MYTIKWAEAIAKKYGVNVCDTSVLDGLNKYCPCVPKYLHDADHTCPCKTMRDTKECHCGLFRRYDSD
jgi:ferredoxin-thioredoxin reductase catalytic subunit